MTEDEIIKSGEDEEEMEVDEEVIEEEEETVNEDSESTEETEDPAESGDRQRMTTVLREKWDKVYSRAYDWLWGTEEKPHHPFSMRGRFKRWFMKKYRGYCDLITTDYDKYEDEYVYLKNLIHKSKLPRDAVHVTGMKNTYHIDLELKKRGFSSDRDQGFTAVDAFLYMKENRISEAMTVKLDNEKGMDTQKLLAFALLGIGGFLAFYFFFMK